MAGVNEELRLFAMTSTRAFGERTGAALGIDLADHEERAFDDGEHKSRPLVSVRDHDAYVIQSLYGDERHSVNDKLCRLLFFLGAVRDAGAASVTAVVPYLCYARKDRKTKSRDPVTTRYVAQLFESVGTDRVVTLDVHNLAAFQNAFRCRTEHLEARTLFVDHLAAEVRDETAVVSPDVGGVKRAEAFRTALADRIGRDVAGGFMEKKRSRGVVSGDVLVGDVRGRDVILVDDMIGTGTTMVRAAKACLTKGARRIYAAATHGLFVGAAEDQLAVFHRIVVTDSIPPRLSDEFVNNKVTVLDAASFIASAIDRLHGGGSIVDLIEHPG
ncbi:MAG: ribose-phosphate pyrophosphokinase [Rhodothermales bacterium]